MKSNLFISIVVVAILGVSAYIAVNMENRVLDAKESYSPWGDKERLDYANTLLAKGLTREAGEAFEEYISFAKSDKKELAKACYRLGSIYMDLFEYERALKNFYKAEMMDKEGEFHDEMNRKIVEALERIGMTSQAKYELGSRASLGGSLKKEGRVLARIGNKEITENQIDRALAMLPQWMRMRYEKDEERRNFIREYVAKEALLEKALRLGIDKTPETRESVEELKKQVVIEQFLKKEMEEKLKIDPSDRELYFKANIDKYSEPAGIRISFVTFENEQEEDSAYEALEKGEGERIKEWIRENQSYLTGVGEAKDVISALFLKDKGETAGPFKIGESFYLFSVNEKKREKKKSYDEVKKQVEYEYAAMKQQEITNALLKEVLESQEVEIYYEPKKGAPETPSENTGEK